jgi:hypothetical protein
VLTAHGVVKHLQAVALARMSQILRKTICVLMLCSVSVLAVSAQHSGDAPTNYSGFADLSKTVLPITEIKSFGPLIESSFGSGFCLDAECRFIATNYHVAVVNQPKKIMGQKIAHVYLATGPNDDGASVNRLPSMNSTKYTPSRDLAIFELRHPVPHFHGIRFSLDELQTGQQVDIFAFPKETVSPFRRLLQFHGSFKGETTTGLLAFGYESSGNIRLRGGASGGIVVDTQTGRIVGVLSAMANNGEAMAFAVPVQVLADLVGKVKPCLAQTIFPSNQSSALSADFYPKYVPSPAGSLEHRPEENVDVRMLRDRAQSLTDGIRNFIAVQTFFWGSGAESPVASAAYEVRVLDGFQKFREYPDGRKYLTDTPFADLNRNITTGGEWANLPEMVGTELRLKIHQAPDAVRDNRHFKVFQFWADKEDAVRECQFLTIADLGFFAIRKVSTNSCYGEVWTDADFNIYRISLHVEIAGKWRNYQSVVTYGWLRRPDDVPRLVPLTISAQAEYNNRFYWCRGNFMNYQVFSSQVKMAVN